MLATTLAVSTIVSAQSVVDASTIHLTERRGWYIPAECPVDLKAEHDKVESEKMRLEFFGWSPENDYPFTLKFPTDKTYRKCFLQYRMSGAPRPADWDMLTEIQVFNPKDGLWYEISRVVTPYGGVSILSGQRHIILMSRNSFHFYRTRKARNSGSIMAALTQQKRKPTQQPSSSIFTKARQTMVL